MPFVLRPISSLAKTEDGDWEGPWIDLGGEG